MHAPDFQQWVRRKDAEKRLKKKLVDECKREIRQELLEHAKMESDMQDGRVKTMERWLANKKLNEAYKITQMRDDTQQQDEIKRDMY